jgi:hypothetical protein
VHVNSVCDGSSDYSMANLECQVQIIILKAAPYNLEYLDSVYFRLSASNIYGTGPVSISGNGAIMVVEADAPLDLTKDVA